MNPEVAATTTPAHGISFDHLRRTWRVHVTVNGQRVFRRARSRPQAMAMHASLIALQDKTAFDRLDPEGQSVDVSGLTDDQVATVLLVIRSFSGPM